MGQKVMQDIRGEAIVARDGAIGAVEDVYFEEEGWTVRDLVVDTGDWLPGRQVLISPRQVLAQPPDDTIRVDLTRQEIEGAGQNGPEPNLRSTAQIVGYAIRAQDGELGHVEDFLIDKQTWEIAGMLIDTRNWLPGKTIVVPLGAIADIDWRAREVSVRMTRDEIKVAAPAG